jgi:hypothetical protein
MTWAPKNKLIIDAVRNLVVGDVVRDFYIEDPTFGVVIADDPAGSGGFVVLWDDGTQKVMQARGGYRIIRALRVNEK